jgi:hypothetical protein
MMKRHKTFESALDELQSIYDRGCRSRQVIMRTTRRGVFQEYEICCVLGSDFIGRVIESQVEPTLAYRVVLIVKRAP